MRITKKLLPVALLSMLLPVAAQAADQGWYVGGKIGAASYEDNRLDEDDTSFGVYGGYQFNPYFAVEGQYTNFGDIEGSLTPPDLGTGSVEPESIGVAAVGFLPIGEQFKLLGKAGFHSYDLNPDGGQDLRDAIGDDSSTDPYYGVGAQFDFTSNFSLRTEYTRFEFGDADNDEISLGLQYTFN